MSRGRTEDPHLRNTPGEDPGVTFCGTRVVPKMSLTDLETIGSEWHTLCLDCQIKLLDANPEKP